MKKITKGKMWVFALGQFGWAILGGIIANFLLFFYEPSQSMMDNGHEVYITQGNAIFGLFTILGVVAMVGRLFDAFTDPLIATASDRLNHRLGRRIPFLRLAPLPFALVTVLVFWLPSTASIAMNNVLITVFLLLFYLFMTLYCTPYNALIPELGKTQEEKINISTFISVTFIFGTAFAFGAPSIWEGLIAGGMERMFAIRITFAGLAFLAFILMLVPAFFINERDYTDATPSESDTFSSLTKTFQNKNFRVFILSDVIYWLALTLYQTGLSFFVVELLGLEESMITVLFVAMTLTSMIFYTPVNILAKKVGKKKLVILGFGIFAGVFAFSIFIGLYGFSTTIQGFMMAVSAAIPMAVLGILPQAIIADIAQAEAIETGENRGGMFYAARTFSMKLGQAVSILLFSSLAPIGDGSGLGYRLALVLAAVFTVLGALVLTRYNESKVLDVLSVLEEDKEEVLV